MTYKVLVKRKKLGIFKERFLTRTKKDAEELARFQKKKCPKCSVKIKKVGKTLRL